ncbi:hypothetical protein HanIR_Chr10g0476141 [Helianthus annuus]|nr:hypothetical protein HanIR_Chr10g0476141 [Helianthus annuus]
MQQVELQPFKRHKRSPPDLSAAIVKPCRFDNRKNICRSVCNFFCRIFRLRFLIQLSFLWCRVNIVVFILIFFFLLFSFAFFSLFLFTFLRL